MKKKVSKALATQREKQLAEEQKYLDVYAGAEGEGFEEFDEDSVAIPRLKILQKSSPECDEDKAEFMDDAKPGMLINSVTKRLYDKDEAIQVIPCAYDKRYNIWIDRDAGGGLVESLPTAAGKELIRTLPRNEKGVPITEEGHLVVDTREHFFLILNTDETVDAVVSSFTSTKVKKSKVWGTLMSLARFPSAPSFRPPMYAFVYDLRTVLETKEQYTYYNWDIQRAFPVMNLPNGRELTDASKVFHDAVLSGQRKAVPENEAAGNSEAY